MRFELSKHNIDKVKKVLEGVCGKTVMINDTNLLGVVSIDITEGEVCDSALISGIEQDGSKRDLIEIIFTFENGRAVHSFYPDEEHCEIIFEADDIWIIEIKDLLQYIEQKKLDLDFQLGEYNKYIDR